MAKQTISVGTSANDGTGDTLRAAFQKTNSNFDELYEAGAASEIHAATSKATPADADELGLVDSAESWVLKKLSWANLKTTLSGVFATLTGKSGGQTLIGGTGVTDKLVLQGTSGNGTSTENSIEFRVGNNGAKSALSVLNSGKIKVANSIAFYHAEGLDNFNGSLFIGDGGLSLSYTAGTEGYYNTGVGIGALKSVTTGNSNTANGLNSLRYNTTGSNNTANGYYSLYSNTTGNNNTANGLNSLYANTAGSSNTALGRDSGRYIADGSTDNATGNNSLFLGYNTKANAGGETNQIVIGYAATGAGSNSVVLGNDSITKTLLKGDVGLGATSPSAKLHIIKTTEQFRLGYDVTYYASFAVNSSGALTQTAIGGQTLIGGTGVTSKITVQGTSGNGTSTATAFEVKVGNNGNITAMYMRNDGNIYIPGPLENTTSGEGIILKSPDGTRYKLTVANGGTLSISAA